MRPYDLVIGDLLYSQLLYPALVDLAVPAAGCPRSSRRYAPRLTRSVVARSMSPPRADSCSTSTIRSRGTGHHQPVTLEQILAAAKARPRSRARPRRARTGPRDSDPRAALSELVIPVRATALWRWPFAPAVDYLACATLAGSTPRAIAATSVG